MIHALLGFAIALAVGLTGIGGGSFTVPALLLIAGLPAGEAVGTAFVFAGVLRLIAAPFYLIRRYVHSRYFRLLLQGAVPGLVIGMYSLRSVASHGSSPVFRSHRERMISRFSIHRTVPNWATAYEFDIVLRGPGATPFEEAQR